MVAPEANPILRRRKAEYSFLYNPTPVHQPSELCNVVFAACKLAHCKRIFAGRGEVFSSYSTGFKKFPASRGGVSLSNFWGVDAVHLIEEAS